MCQVTSHKCVTAWLLNRIRRHAYAQPSGIIPATTIRHVNNNVFSLISKRKQGLFIVERTNYRWIMLHTVRWEEGSQRKQHWLPTTLMHASRDDRKSKSNLYLLLALGAVEVQYFTCMWHNYATRDPRGHRTILCEAWNNVKQLWTELKTYS